MQAAPPLGPDDIPPQCIAAVTTFVVTIPVSWKLKRRITRQSWGRSRIFGIAPLKAVFGLAWKKAEQEEAKKRQGTRTDIVETLPQSDTGKSRDKIGERVGVSGKSIDKIGERLQRDAQPLFCLARTQPTGYVQNLKLPLVTIR